MVSKFVTLVQIVFLALAFSFTSFAVAGTPDGIVLAATDITGTSATLNGLVNPNNESTTVSFEYSRDSNFGEESVVFTVSADESPLTGNGYMIVSKPISGLAPGTAYHFRIISVNASATDTSTETTFTTSLPASVSTGVASPVTTTTAKLNAMVNAEGNSTVVTFEYGLTNTYGTTVTADQSPVTGSSDTAVSKDIVGLAANTTYHFRVVGVNIIATSEGDDRTFFTSAQGAPTVSTESATYHLTPNTATLNGTVNANNSDATTTFEYGISNAYGTTVTADESPVLGSSDTAVSKLISGLTPDTLYHYRAVSANSQGTTLGADQTFYNTIAPFARTDAASDIGLTTAIIRGTVNPKRYDDSRDTTVYFEYGLTNAYGTSTDAIQTPLDGYVEQAVNLNLSGLTANTTYHYRVVAMNPNGTGTGLDGTFTTSALPIVSTNSATPVGLTSATLNGSVNANGDSTDVTFEYGTTTAYGTTVTASPSPVSGTNDTWVSQAIGGLTNGTTYHFRVVGVNFSGTSEGEDLTFTTGVSPPSVTTDAATNIGTDGSTMNGTVNANGVTTDVLFEYGLDSSYGMTGNAAPSPVSGSSDTAVVLNVNSLLPNTIYHYRVVAQSAGGTIYGSDMSFTTTATPNVATDAATAVSTSGATLNGMVNANDQSSTVTFEYGTTTAYGTTVTADQSPVAGSVDTAVSKTVTGLTMNTTYHYRAVAVNASGTSAGEDMTFFTSTPAAPGVVTDAADSVTSSGAVLNGTVNANNASTAVTFEYGTTVAYGSIITADPATVTGTISTVVSQSITGLSNNTTYHYRAVGQSSNGTTNGADMTFTTDALTPSVVTGGVTNLLYTSATVNGIANGNVAGATVTFEYGLTVAYGTSVSATPSSVPGDLSDYAVFTNLSGLTPGTTYHYRVVADNIFVSPQNGADMTFTTPLGPEAVTSAATAVNAYGATLNGSANAQNASATVTFEYGVDTNYGLTVVADQSPVVGGSNTPVSYVLGGMIPNTTYHYRAVVQNINGTAVGADVTFTTTSIAPTVLTEAASEVLDTTAMLHGFVNAEGDSTTVTFEYGINASYGTTVTADQSPVTGSSNTPVNKAIGGLTTSTTYHYRVVGQNGVGTSNGGNMTFTTGGVAPIAETTSAIDITVAGATLRGNVNANDQSTTVVFEYGSDTNYGKTKAADQSPLTGSINTEVTSYVNDVAVGTTVHYRVMATNTSGTSYGDDKTFLIEPTADISVTKTDGVTTAVPGESVTYTIVAANAGPSADPSVSLTDTFPTPPLSCAYTSVAAGGATGNTAAGAGDLAETLSLPSGSSVTYTATCDIDADATGTLSNTATVSASVADTNAANDSATDADTVLVPEADISVTKTDGVTTAVPGESVTYTIVAANAGPSADPSVSLTDTFPTPPLSCAYTSVAAGGATGNTEAGAGDLAETLSLPSGSSVTYTATCDIDADATGTLSNTATVTASVTDGNATNDSATDADTVLDPEADISVTKTDGVTSAVPGESITYTIVAANAGPSDDPSVSLADTFPTELTCTYTSVAAGGATGNTAVGAGDLAETLSMPVGSSVTYTATCDIDSSANGTLSNTATVTASVTDINAANDSATDGDTVLAPETYLSVTKSSGVETVLSGSNLTYTLAVTNNGSSDSSGGEVIDVLPTGLSFVSSASGCTELAGTVTCPFGSLTVGSTVELNFVALVTLNESGTITNIVTVAGNEYNPNASAQGVDSTKVWPVFAPIPTLSAWMLLLMTIMLSAIGLRALRSKP